MFAPKIKLTGHNSTVTCAKFSPDGLHIASCSEDGIIKLWDSNNGKFIRQLMGHTQGINELCWSSDGKLLASASDDNSIRIWNTDNVYDVNSCNTVRILANAHAYHVTAVDFNFKSNMLVSGSADEDVIIWSTIKGQAKDTLQAHTDPITSVKFSPDGTVIASAGHDGLIRTWDSQSSHCLFSFITPEKSPITCLEFTPNGKYLLAGSMDGKARLWALIEGKCAKTFTIDDDDNDSGAITAAQFWRGSHLLIASQHRIGVYDLQSRMKVDDIKNFHSGENILYIHVMDDRMVSCGTDQSIIVYERV